ncbi:hypothetical protein [Nesterenkonia alkaliphila]|uniref:Uncharacterized protein n=1 Tax=Nesterenkonia alkaliphila TaxID=1463631 RepID=A0A7K1UH43_9MICC|nr:hypothetical protein [Nesterenkonia alkaliphila]MVT25724.1 hypothetical protein [Nesterenkonia alkaliphila]GFZ85377.1 hypothetical protein GCM10011359_13120 [Nesterenkonia alkaliphila]
MIELSIAAAGCLLALVVYWHLGLRIWAVHTPADADPGFARKAQLMMVAHGCIWLTLTPVIGSWWITLPGVLHFALALRLCQLSTAVIQHQQARASQRELEGA